ncbi:hypothetical protein GCM10023196_059530 [Actinoallomurus vinaceus]|uniref:Uncharacterized protein n=1 Tax=Actinoallomurus vinaceus TaxID=1080074 RepID=A0ABP8UHI6_9ACTN
MVADVVNRAQAGASITRGRGGRCELGARRSLDHSRTRQTPGDSRRGELSVSRDLWHGPDEVVLPLRDIVGRVPGPDAGAH